MFTRILKVFFLLALVSLLVTCNNYEFPKSPYPRVETLPVARISETGVTFQANILQLAKHPIINHGFVWGTDERVSIQSDDKVELGAIEDMGDFNADVKSSLYDGETYFVKAFVATADYFVYGEAVSFTSMGSTPPVIESFSPSETTLGDTILIKGKYFSAKSLNNGVKFGTASSKVVTSNDSVIVCVVPNGIPNTVPIFVTVAGNKTQSANNFIVARPVINDFTPVTGTFEETVTINGLNFGLIKENITMKFNDQPAQISNVSKTQLKVIVPSSILAKENSISVSINNQISTSSIKFTVLPPSISVISSSQGFIGNTIQIQGANFCPVSSGNKVFFDKAQAQIVSTSKTVMSVKIPGGIYQNRTFKIEVRVAEQSAFSADFTLLNAWIRKADLPLGNLPEMGPRRYGAVAFAINGKGYAGLGGDRIDNSFYTFDPIQNTWSLVAPFPGGPRRYSASFVINDIAYVGMGVGADPYIGGGNGNKDLWRYDPQLNTWQQMANLPLAEIVGAAYGFSRNGKGYIVTQNSQDNFWEYNPATNTWTQKEDVPITPWYYVDCGFVIDDRAFILLRDTYGAPYKLWEYDFLNSSWIQRTAPDTGYSSGTKGFAINGFGYFKFNYYLYKYNPNANSWTKIYYPDIMGGAFPIEFVIGDKAYYGTGNSTGVDIWEFDPNYE